VYLAITQYLGFPTYGDEYKVMGLAPYGEPDYVDALRRLIHLKPGGGFEIELSYFRHHSEGVSMTWDDGEPVIGPVYTGKLEQLLGPARKPGEPLEARHEAVAASLQVVFEEAASHVLNALYRKTRLPRLAWRVGAP
jgi:carbamoyltransferase